MADHGEQLRTAIVDWLEAEREAVLGVLRGLGVPDDLKAWVQVVTKVTESETSFASELRTVNPLTVDSVASRIDWRKVPQRPGPAEQIASAYGRQAWYWQGAMIPDFDADPVGWIQARLLDPALQKFLRTLPMFSEPARAVAADAVNELLTLIESDDVVLRVRLPVDGLRFIERMGAGPVVLRPLEPAEVVTAHQALMGSFRDDAVQFHLPAMGMQRAMLEITELRRKSAPRSPAELMRRIILALQLLGFSPTGPGHFTWKELPYGVGTSFAPVHIAERGTTSDLTQVDLERAVKLADRIPSGFASSQSREDIALSRFAQGCADKFAADALIDLVIALEAVLLPREFQGELSFRFALNGAHAIGATATERKTLFREFASVYSARSDIVHGKHVESEELKANVEIARRLSAAVLRRGLEVGWPNQDEFRDAALS